MDYLVNLFTQHSVAQVILVLSLVIATGLLFGSIRVFGIQLGIAGVLFSGILFAQLGFHIEKETMDFVRELGLVFFVYTIGMQLGPGFMNSFKKDGLRFNVLAAVIVLSGVAITWGIIRFAGVDKAVAVGLFSGATTNTPSLAAAGEALRGLGGDVGRANLPGVGYAVAYPFGILGIILTMILTKTLFRLDPAVEAARHVSEHNPHGTTLDAINLDVTSANLDGLRVRELPFLEGSPVVISRILHAGSVSVAQADSVLRVGDTVLAVGPKHKLEELRRLVGAESATDIRNLPQAITTKRFVVTHKEILGKTADDLGLRDKYGVTLTRLIRAEVQFPVTGSVRLQYGDVLIAVGEEAALKKIAALLGNSPSQLNHPQIIPVFVGIFLGILLGTLPIYLPGVPVPVKLGLAGGPLIVALILSRTGHWGPFVWYLPTSANFMMREIGITLFLACVGLKSGDSFISTLTQGDGFYWMGLAALITFVPLFLAALYCRLRYKMNFLTLCGLLAGSMTDPPALAFANSFASSNAPGVSYASVYPLVMLLRILSAQLIVLFF